MSVRGAVFLGVGSMVGAGIFALLGEAGTVAGAAVWVSFLLAGIVAGLLGYTAVTLGVRFPSRGGVIAIAAIGVTAVVLVFFAVDTLRNDAWTFVAIVLIAVLAVVLDAIWKRRAPMAGPGPESSPIPVPVPR
jgi:amino acid transporter